MTEKYQQVHLGLDDEYHRFDVGQDSSGREIFLNGRTIAMLDEADRRLGFDLSILQGSYMGDDAADASGSTHDGGGVVDIRTSDLTPEQQEQALLVLREVGFAAWHRTTSGFDVDHLHMVSIGDKDLASSAQDQVVAYRAGGDGLVGDTPDDGPRVPIHAFDYEAAVLGFEASHSGQGADNEFNAHTGNPITSTDQDGDNLTDMFEQLIGTKLDDPDSDNDGLTDLQETTETHTDPLSKDTDEDGRSDLFEIRHGTDPGTAALPQEALAAGFGGGKTLDQDHDGLSDLTESQLGTDPTLADSDADHVSDAVEYRLGSNPLDMDTNNDGIVDPVAYSEGTLGPAPTMDTDSSDGALDSALDSEASHS